MPSKVCTKCGVEKSLDEFRKRTDRGDRRNVCTPCDLEAKRANYQKNRESRLQKAVQWHRNNSEFRHQYGFAYRHGIDRPSLERSKRPKKRPEDRINKWEQPEFKAARKHARRARLALLPGVFTAEEWKALKQFYQYTCLCCGSVEPTISLQADHVVPIVCGGSNDIGNIQPLCGLCNRKKHAKTIDYRPKPYASEAPTITVSTGIHYPLAEDIGETCYAAIATTSPTPIRTC